MILYLQNQGLFYECLNNTLLRQPQKILDLFQMSPCDTITYMAKILAVLVLTANRVLIPRKNSTTLI